MGGSEPCRMCRIYRLAFLVVAAVLCVLWWLG